VAKRSTGDLATTTAAVAVDYSGDLTIANSHLRMKPSARVLMVKEVSNKYFEQYDKKDIFGKEYWRDEMQIELNEF
jgi:hypothetical protein